MTTPMQESMTSGVYVEARDVHGNTIAQTVITDWGARPVPAVGDTLRCPMAGGCGRRAGLLSGRVVSRHFEVQRDARQRSSVWVALVIVVSGRGRQSKSIGPPATRFSRN